jgi:hypothetical protein
MKVLLPKNDFAAFPALIANNDFPFQVGIKDHQTMRLMLDA